MVDARTLTAKLNATPDSPAPELKKISRTRRVIGAGASILLTLVLVVLSAMMLISSAARSASDAAELRDASEPAFQAQKSLDDAQDQEAALPDPREGKRWLEQAEDDVQAVAQLQNTFLVETGPLDFSQVPQMNPKGNSRLSDDERIEIAEANRLAARGDSQRALVPRFGSEFGDTDFNPVADWSEQIPELALLATDPETTLLSVGHRVTLEESAAQADQRSTVTSTTGTETESPAAPELLGGDDFEGTGFVWTPIPPRMFDENGMLPVAWRLNELGTGRLVAVVTAQYSATNARYSDAVILLVTGEDQ